MSDFHTESKITARKTHTCGECRAEISAGQVYVREAGVFDGQFYTSKHCRSCAALIHYGWNSHPQIFDSNSGRTLGGLLDDYIEGEAVYFDDHDKCHITDEYAHALEVDPVKNWPRIKAQEARA